ncbi:Protease inhibitor protein [Plasmopara halstedii]|uniref:Protease inhibitor protein n=1 Tax=Plasmopara halstedii TaxID=4781 RepID=A0A0P1B0S9_PLAHL|nr:Protease inhibitor protein [Plasmopara halstedii]CEG48273.1 Protease inhibitor protein [Plasmopara halstedii]|eukprot:XP_024584642.1 Protease inhibitor protein [Plasmopara halstedii]
MKLSLTFSFAAVTVTSSCATASVVDNHHEHASIRHNTLPCTDALCDDGYPPVCGFGSKTYPNACIYQATNCRTNVTMAYSGPSRDNQRVHLSASATSLNEKSPLICDHTHSANEERHTSFRPEIPSSFIFISHDSERQRVLHLFSKATSIEDLSDNLVHPYIFLEVLYRQFLTRDFESLGATRFLGMRANILVRNTLFKPPKKSKRLTKAGKKAK